MKRQMRKLSRKIERKFGEAKSMATNFVRSNSSYSYSHRPTYISTTISPHLSDNDDDDDNDIPVFEGIPANESMDNTHDTSNSLIPCEFCTTQQSVEHLNRHQLVCLQNPANGRRRRNLAPDTAPTVPRRRAISDNLPVAPSAPPRSRSPSPTEGFPVPSDLVCPITQTLFRDPVVANDGHTYEREAIKIWLRTSQLSPMTREAISVKQLNPNRVIKKMADDFRAECKRKRSMYKYKLDVDIKKLESITKLQTDTKTYYQAEWIKNCDSKVILVHLTGNNAEKIVETNIKLTPHPNIVRTSGRVEHNDNGVLIVQDYLPEENLSQLIKHSKHKLSMTIIDTILCQIACALQHLANHGIIYGNVNNTENIFIYQIDETEGNILVKLTNIGEFDGLNHNQDENLLEKTDVYAFGLLARELYSLELETNDEDLTERQKFYEHCLSTDPNDRPTFNDLTKSLIDLSANKKFVFPIPSSTE